MAGEKIAPTIAVTTALPDNKSYYKDGHHDTGRHGMA